MKSMDYFTVLFSLQHFLLLATSLSILTCLLRRRFSPLRRPLRLPPGTLGLPFLGETLQIISAYKTSNPEPFVDDRVSGFGPVFTTHIFGEPTVFSADPETNRFILMNEGKLFETSYPGSITNLLGRNSLLLLSTGSLHKRLHSLTMSFANSTIIRDHLMADIDRLVRLNLESWTGRILLMEETKRISFDLTMKQLITVEPCEWTERLRKEYTLVIDGFFTMNPFPLFSTTYRRAIQARAKVAAELSLVVRERRASERGERKNNMLGALLDEEGGGGGGLSDEEIVDFLVSILVAGYESTPTIMALRGGSTLS
ncbi:hypothetical protein Vadar_032042 [Vaccinium darrowii]|uniref:Uncharacterized protein n=1 Tax=Vaccinium darrowii TaxID=229202 RepID=A0ACB7Y4J4_9ERIC|nr:hypothetical protein Vadar_032042 [Vaccinium darrowii]